MEDVTLPFGLKEGELVEVSEVERGLQCGCFCPNCNSPLIARKGGGMIHHFAHKNEGNCKGALETTLHLGAKDILDRFKKIMLPPVITFLRWDYSILLYNEQTLVFDKISLEKRLDDIIPDIIIEIQGKELIIEIAVSHYIDNRKKEKIERLNISTLEIDLRKYKKHINFKELEDILINTSKHKSWIYNTKEQNFIKEIKGVGKEMGIIKRGTHHHVDHCPLHVRNWEGRTYANYDVDCFKCNFNFGNRYDDLNSQDWITCLGHAKMKVIDIIIKYKAKTNNNV
jgi:hypothetical protein